MVQRHAARGTLNRHHNTTSIKGMLEDLQWRTLEQQRTDCRLVLLLQIIHSQIPPTNRPYSRCQSLKPSLVFLNRASYGRRRNNDVTSKEREVAMILCHNLRTDAQICGKSASQASLFVRHGRGVNRVYYLQPSLNTSLVQQHPHRKN